MEMESTTQELKHRTKDQPPITAPDNDVVTNTKPTQKRSPLPKRGIQSLCAGIAVPLALTLANIALFGWSRSYQTTHKPFWIPPLWALHLTCLSSAFVMALSAWLVWAEGGFHKTPAAMGLYLAQLGLSLAWDPIFFKMGAAKVGLLVCLAQMGTMLSCSRMFRRINETAGDLVKLCFIWAGFLTLVNLYFVA
ncbi:translocator protein homolog [Cynara cardunculus var. scolymus]|uniref:TspO/MBR-related protein n=1 Tax=Cynara cardunculus var. scolymus TaxID=59895 RepID=A0A118K290_CYNCS|nr:translocator protein homolog [Cynara cardunculus var. scolymus]KVI03992.1 TspO/MBR-related protein [Cynara cardunculus var. scolymus]